MKLFLSSLNLAQLPEKLIPEFKSLLSTKRSGGKRPRVLMIHNASDYKGAEFVTKRNEDDAVLNQYDIDVQSVDLRKFESDKKALETVVEKVDAIFMGGGNTFYLRYWLQKTGADEILTQQAKKGLVLGGGSAGAIVISPSLSYFDAADDPTEAPEAVWDGLGLVDFEPLPHADSEKYGDITQTIKKSFEEDGKEAISLNDDQAIIIDGAKRRII